MSEENKEKVEIQEIEENVVTRQKDALLLSLILMADKEVFDLEVGLTLNIGGAIISGTLISRDKYLSMLIDSIKSSGSEMGNILADQFKGFQEMVAEADKEDKEKGEAPLPNFIHLRNAKFFAPGNAPIPANQGMLWRGRLDSIDGFTLGNLS